MPIRKSAGAIIFRREYTNTDNKTNQKDKIYYLVLKYPTSSKNKKPYWGFAKGTIEKNEKVINTIHREIQEETGITDMNFIKGFKASENYFFKDKRETIFKTVFYLLAETKEKNIKISHEHEDFIWLEYEKAMETLTFKNAKEMLEKANKFVLNIQKENAIQGKGI